MKRMITSAWAPGMVIIGICLFLISTPSLSGDAKRATAGAKRDEGDYVVEKRADGTTVKYKRKTTYDFEGSSIDGVYNKPSGSYISNIKDVKAKSIIRIRENFDAEVIDSSRQIK